MGGSGGGAEYTVRGINKLLVNCTNRKGLEWPAERPEVLEGCGPRCDSPPLTLGLWRPAWSLASTVGGGLFLPLLQGSSQSSPNSLKG